MSYMDALWIKITNSYSKWPPLACTQSLSLCGHSSVKLRNTSTGKSAAASWRDRFKFSVLDVPSCKPSLQDWTTICSPRGLGPDLQKANLKWRWCPEHLCPATAGLSVPCGLELSPARSSSSVHGRGCCKKREAANFPVVLRNSIDEWPQRLKDCVHANSGHFE